MLARGRYEPSTNSLRTQERMGKTQETTLIQEGEDIPRKEGENPIVTENGAKITTPTFVTHADLNTVTTKLDQVLETLAKVRKRSPITTSFSRSWSQPSRKDVSPPQSSTIESQSDMEDNNKTMSKEVDKGETTKNLKLAPPTKA